MGKLIYKCDESMGTHHWETTVYTSECGTEISLTQTWFDGVDIQSQQSIVMLSKEIHGISNTLKGRKQKNN
jgi:hypothetical protein|tara:strand:- start:1332 stop:1544 length:213 start_codon:yes stop_codon:yes gene_type:complete